MLRSAGVATVPRFSVELDASFKVPWRRRRRPADTEFAEISGEGRIGEREFQVGDGVGTAGVVVGNVQFADRIGRLPNSRVPPAGTSSTPVAPPPRAK